MMNSAFIEFEAFVDNDGSYIIKELCILSPDDMFNPIYYLFFPSQSWRDFNKETAKTNQYLQRRHHKLQWFSGYEKFCADCVMFKIKSSFDIKTTIFYIMGAEYGKKIETIRKLFPSLRIIGYKVHHNQLSNISPNIKCISDHASKHCAYMKCMKLIQHFIKCD